MIIEDDKDTVRALGVRLKSNDYNLIVATDAISAVSTARKEKPDLIVLDLGFPGGDGFIVMKRLRSQLCRRRAFLGTCDASAMAICDP